MLESTECHARSCFNNWISRGVVHGTIQGPSPYLVAAEEKELSLFLIDTAKSRLLKNERSKRTGWEMLRIREENKDEKEKGRSKREREQKRRKQLPKRRLRKEKLKKRQQRSENEKARKAAEREIRSSKNTVSCLASKKCKTSLESCQSALGSTTAVTSSAAASVTTKGRKFSDCCTCYHSFADDEREETG